MTGTCIVALLVVGDFFLRERRELLFDRPRVGWLSCEGFGDTVAALNCSDVSDRGPFSYGNGGLKAPSMPSPMCGKRELRGLLWPELTLALERPKAKALAPEARVDALF